jgi:hypothetical protein
MEIGLSFLLARIYLSSSPQCFLDQFDKLGFVVLLLLTVAYCINQINLILES